MEFDKFHIEGDDGICTVISRELHRYHSVNQYLIDSLMGNYIWFSNPEDFNDPYDCNLDFDFECTRVELEAFFREINNMPENAYRKKSESELQEEITKCVDNPEVLRQRNREQSIDGIKRIGVCCFSEHDDRLLMWSHYGNKHQGACLTFDINEHKELFLQYPYSVEYPQRYPKINWIKERGLFKPFRFEFATKSLEWSYEAEVRIIRNEKNPPYRNEVKFNKKALKAIKFGYKSTAADQISIKETLNKAKGYEHVRFYSAKLKHLDFGIEYEEIFKQ
ncbi:DUF2971 domain-containing protein [Mucilaginibacter sp.]|uniref:DUF2971 domain-containing protein n=1 Tax=Mucilaginibacter sp. TaxID=1882438 RepID=UPI00284B3CF4|nr:DUF2971 domain-containing protein [Mucilaginibacter sp.]MDR3695276.1 DUF2971 domain-containing protein [Mucilaginibacter sp.]